MGEFVVVERISNLLLNRKSKLSWMELSVFNSNRYLLQIMQSDMHLINQNKKQMLNSHIIQTREANERRNQEMMRIMAILIMRMLIIAKVRVHRINQTKISDYRVTYWEMIILPLRIMRLQWRIRYRLKRIISLQWMIISRIWIINTSTQGMKRMMNQ